MKKLIFIFILLSSFFSKKPYSESKMIFVEGTEFTMGQNRIDTSLRQHNVFLDNFYISKYETTLAEFSSFVKETGYITQLEKVYITI